MARLWAPDADVTMLSDDRVVLRAEGSQIWMYGTPWHGDGGFASPARVPLTAMFLLKEGPRHRLRGSAEPMRFRACLPAAFRLSTALKAWASRSSSCSRWSPAYGATSSN